MVTALYKPAFGKISMLIIFKRCLLWLVVYMKYIIHHEKVCYTKNTFDFVLFCFVLSYFSKANGIVWDPTPKMSSNSSND